MEKDSREDSRLPEFVRRRPRVIAWLVLSAGMVTMLLFSTRSQGLRPSQLATLAFSTIVLAGLCVWVIGWE